MLRNLLHDRLNLTQVEELLGSSRTPLIPPLDSQEWKRVALNPPLLSWKKAVRELAEREREQPLPVLTDELYSDFHRTGVRLRFENLYFERRRRLARAALALLMSEANDSGRAWLIKSLIEKTEEVFSEVSWALPAHTATGSTGKDPMRLDLFCCETANLMAELLDLFGAILPGDLQKRIRERLQKFVFENFRDHHRDFWWTQHSNNWNAVCHQGVLGAALSQLEDTKLLAELLFIARETLPTFLGGFGRDGGSSEGPVYWGYGFGWFTVLNEQLETRSGGRLSLFEGDSHIAEIARFGARMSLHGGNLVNFADCPAHAPLRPSLLMYLGKRLNDPVIQSLAVENYHSLVKEGLDWNMQRADVFCLVRLCLYCPESFPEKTESVRSDFYFQDLGVLVAHGKDEKNHQWSFAAKGGHNEEHHNHNDCGSYLLNIDGRRFIDEIGMPEYNREFFGATRYEFLAARTKGHSLPIINGCEQPTGKEVVARVLKSSSDDCHAEFEVDVTQAYPAEAGCAKYLRHFFFDKRRGKLTVRDSFELTRTESLEVGLMTHSPVQVKTEQAEIQGRGLTLILRPQAGTIFAGVETHTYQEHDQGKDTLIHRLVLKPTALLPKVEIGVEIELAG